MEKVICRNCHSEGYTASPDHTLCHCKGKLVRVVDGPQRISAPIETPFSRRLAQTPYIFQSRSSLYALGHELFKQDHRTEEHEHFAHIS